MIDVAKFVVRIPLGMFNRRHRWFGTRPLSTAERKAAWELRVGEHRAHKALAGEPPDIERVIRTRKRHVPRARASRLPRVPWRRTIR